MRRIGRLFGGGGKTGPVVARESATLDEPSVIGIRVMKARRRRGWSQTRLAAELGRSDRWVRLLESGELPWVRRIEDGCSPAPHDLRVLTAVAGVLELDLADLMRAPDVVAPAAIAMTPSHSVPSRRLEREASVSAPERPAVPIPGRPLPRDERRVARLSRGRMRMLDAVASPVVFIGAATMAAGVVAASAAAGIVRGDLHSQSVSTQSPHVAIGTSAPDHALVPPVTGAPRPAPALVPPPVVAPPAPDMIPGAPPLAAPLPPLRLAAVPVVAGAHAVRPSGPVVSLSTSAIDFGTVRAGSAVSRTVTVTNTGTVPVHIGVPMVLMGSDLTTSTTCMGRTLAPRQHCSITETFAPGGRTRLNAVVMLTDDTPQGREDLDVRGTSA